MDRPNFNDALEFFDRILEQSDLSTNKIWVRGGQIHLRKGRKLMMRAEAETTSEEDIKELFNKYSSKVKDFLVFYVVGTLGGKTICTLLGDQFTLDDEDDSEESDKVRKDWGLIFCASESWGEPELVVSKIKWLAMKNLTPSQLSNLDYMYV